MSGSQRSWWRERRPPAEVSYVGNAAVGRSSLATLAAMASYAEPEAATRGYGIRMIVGRYCPQKGSNDPQS